MPLDPVSVLHGFKSVSYFWCFKTISLSPWQKMTVCCDVEKTKPLANGSSKPRAAAGSQADHPELLCVALHLSRAQTALHLTGYMWLLLGEVLCIKVSGIYSSLTAGRSRHRKIMKFVCLPLQKLTKTVCEQNWAWALYVCACVSQSVSSPAWGATRSKWARSLQLRLICFGFCKGEEGGFVLC